MHFRVARTWDGVGVEPDEIVELTTRLSERSLVLEVDAPYHGDPAPPLPPGSCPELWNYEVAECFLVGDDEHYLELECGPHGHYLLLELRGTRNIERQGMAADYRVERSGARWRGRLELDRKLLPGTIRRVNAFAIHGAGAARRYLCWEPLPGPQPDFHQLERFPRFEP